MDDKNWTMDLQNLAIPTLDYVVLALDFSYLDKSWGEIIPTHVYIQQKRGETKNKGDKCWYTSAPYLSYQTINNTSLLTSSNSDKIQNMPITPLNISKEKLLTNSIHTTTAKRSYWLRLTLLDKPSCIAVYLKRSWNSTQYLVNKNKSFAIKVTERIKPKVNMEFQLAFWSEFQNPANSLQSSQV